MVEPVSISNNRAGHGGGGALCRTYGFSVGTVLARLWCLALLGLSDLLSGGNESCRLRVFRGGARHVLMCSHAKQNSLACGDHGAHGCFGQRCNAAERGLAARICLASLGGYGNIVTKAYVWCRSVRQLRGASRLPFPFRPCRSAHSCVLASTACAYSRLSPESLIGCSSLNKEQVPPW